MWEMAEFKTNGKMGTLAWGVWGYMNTTNALENNLARATLLDEGNFTKNITEITGILKFSTLDFEVPPMKSPVSVKYSYKIVFKMLDDGDEEKKKKHPRYNRLLRPTHKWKV